MKKSSGAAVKAAAGAALVSMTAVVIGLVVIAGGGASPPAAAATTTGNAVCATTGPLAGLSSVAATNARLIVAAAESSGGQQAAVIAVAVGISESGLRILGNTDGQQGTIPVQGIGSDHDSIGIFQQRPSWGTVTERLDPTLSTGLFVSRLLRDSGWATKAPWVVAQDIQVSAYDGNPRAANNYSSVYGGNYEPSVAKATAIVAAVSAGAAPLVCGTISGAVAANKAAGSRGLPADYTIPANASSGAVKAISFAIAQLDKPYVFDMAGPASFDCSGLTMAAWATAGVSLVHYTGAQVDEGTGVSEAAMLPGDLVLIPGADGTLAHPGHVGIYLGRGLVLSAADPRDGILVQAWASFTYKGLSAIRHVG